MQKKRFTVQYIRREIFSIVKKKEEYSKIVLFGSLKSAAKGVRNSTISDGRLQTSRGTLNVSLVYGM